MKPHIISAGLKHIDMSERCPMVAIIHKKNYILSIGSNNAHKTHPRSQREEGFNSGIHAELRAIMKVKYKDLTNCEITILRLAKYDGKSLKMAKPCKHCQALIQEYGIKKIHYSNEYGSFTTIRLKKEK